MTSPKRLYDSDLAIIEGHSAADVALGRLNGKRSLNLEPVIESEEEVEYRTLADIDDTPPAELQLGMFEPDGPNMIYGPGGVGKGSTAAYLVGEFIKHGLRPMIYEPLPLQGLSEHRRSLH